MSISIYQISNYMKNFIILLISVLLALATNCLYAQKPMDKDFEKKLKKAYKYGKKAHEVAKDLVNTYDQCIAYGNSQEYCQKAAGICATWNFATQNLPGLPAEIYRKLQLFESFKPYCGYGICFQCCFTGANCHTSFIGFPVINCNANYGPATRPAGLTMIVDPDPQPGQACLFTPQTCSHLPLCSSNLTAQQIANINNDPNHIMKRNLAIQERARTFAHYGLEFGFSNFLNTFSPGKPVLSASGNTLEPEPTMDDLLDLIFSRGSPYWSDLLDSLEVNGGDIDGFRITDTITNQVLESPTKWNLIRQLFLANYLNSLPNLYNRLSFTESKIWTDSDKMAYISDSILVDSIFLKNIHPFALRILSENHGVQDYRLLSVPLPGESSSDLLYNGDTLGNPPVFEVENITDTEFKIHITNPGTHSVKKTLGLLILWGDGTTTETETNVNEDKIINHNYEKAGNYRLIVYVQNSSGLRSIFLKSIDVSTTQNQIATPSYSLVKIHRFGASTSLFTFMGRLFFSIHGQNEQESFEIGRSKTINMGNNQKIVFDSTLHLYNSNLKVLNNINIIPHHTLNNGRSYIYLDKKIYLSVFNPQMMTDTFLDYEINIDSIKLYDKNDNLINDKSLIIQDTSQSIKIYFLYDTIKAFRIEIPIANSLSLSNYIQPNSILKPDIEGLFQEKTLDRFFEYSNSTNNAEPKTPLPEVKVYPNPSKNFIFITRQPNDLSRAVFSLYNSNGQTVESILLLEGQYYYDLDISHLAPAAYFWTYESDSMYTMGKVIKISN